MHHDSLPSSPGDPRNPPILRALHNEVVMVNPGRSETLPAVGMRGTIRITPEGEAHLVLDFAVMFDRPAASTIIPLSTEQIRSLIRSKEKHGACSLTLPDDIVPPAVLDHVVASPRL